MASITIRQLDDGLKQRLRVRAAEHGRSMEDEVREIIRDALDKPRPPQRLGSAMRVCFSRFGDIELEIPPHDSGRELPDFDK